MSAESQHDDIRMAMAEAGGALTENDLDAAESKLLRALSEVRRRQQRGGASE